MKTTVPIKSDLFRFVTLRTPDHLPQNGTSIHFIHHPNVGKSAIAGCPRIAGGDLGNEAAFLAYLNGFNAVKLESEIRAMQPELYEFSDALLKRPSQLQKYDTDQRKAMQLQEAALIALFDQLIYQVITCESVYVRQACIQLLLGNEYLRLGHSPGKDAAKDALAIKIVIPKEVMQCFKPWRYKHCEGEINAVNSLGIADFRRVEQEVCCYVPGEVSHIENILAREYKERSTRNLTRSEMTLETTREVEMEKLSDVTTTARNELNTEISSVLNEDQSANYGGSLGVSAKIFGAQVNANAFANFASNNSSSNSNSSAQSYAQEVTKRALERILQRTTEKRTSKIIREFEENNKHGFDNRNGDQHVTGIYRWVDIIYTNRLVNYGKRLMYEFLVPEPATLFKRVQAYKPKIDAPAGTPSPTGPTPPKTLAEIGVTSANSITRDNYATLGSAYGITISSPLEAQKTVSQAFAPTPPLTHNSTAWTQTFNVTVEPDYEADSASGNYTFEYKAWGFAPDAYFTYNIGGLTGGMTGLRSSTRKPDGDSIAGTFVVKHTMQVPVIFQGRQLFTFAVSLTVVCKLKASKFQEWQAAAYGQLQQAYAALQSQYESELEQSNATGGNGTDSSSNEEAIPPAMKRIVEQRELKRACMEMVTRPFCRVEGKKLYTDLNACDLYQVPQIKLTHEFEQYSEQVKFLEQAFDWSLMSYLFYPYYWADKCDWAALMQSKDSDLIFQAFLQAGMARVVVPVRPEFEEAVTFYLETGDIWLGGSLVAESEGSLYQSILEDLHTVQGTVEDEWETRVPTTLAIVQNKSAQLNQEGLPCCTVVETVEQTSDIVGASNVLQIIKP